MEENDATDADVIELVVQLCTRIGMIMEDVSLVALDPARDGLNARVREIAAASGRIATLVGAAQALLSMAVGIKAGVAN